MGVLQGVVLSPKKQDDGKTNVLKKILPWIGAACAAGAPALPFLAPVAAVIGTITGKSVTPDAGSIVDALASATPEQRLAIIKEHDDFAAQMQQMGFQNEQAIEAINEKDRDSARQREIAVKDWTPKVLAFLIAFAFVGTIVYVLSGHAKADAALAGTLIGYLAAKSDLVYAYYFGSSAGSDRKTELLATAPAIQQ